MSKVLVIEDEAHIRRFIEINLLREGFEVHLAESGEIALEWVEKDLSAFQVILLDVNLPGKDGFNVCMSLRDMGFGGIIMMLTARGQDMERIMGLDLGADDYIVKPFNPLELAARIRAFLRRNQRHQGATQDKTLAFGHLVIDLENRIVSVSGQEVDLSPKILELLFFLVSNPDKALHRDEILNGVWGEDFFGDYKTVDVHIRRLREKIELDPSNPKLIETVWGVGYRWRKAVKPL